MNVISNRFKSRKADTRLYNFKFTSPLSGSQSQLVLPTVRKMEETDEENCLCHLHWLQFVVLHSIIVPNVTDVAGKGELERGSRRPINIVLLFYVNCQEVEMFTRSC